MTHEAALPTRAGEFRAVFTPNGLAGLEFPAARRRPAPPLEQLPAPIRTWARTARAALETALAGRTPDRLPPLDEAGTDFQRAVWRALRAIPAGEVRTYGEVAREIGGQTALARAVGQACGRNPIPVLTPCHRVVATGGKLGGFSGGLDWKRRLLNAESASARAVPSGRGGRVPARGVTGR